MSIRGITTKLTLPKTDKKSLIQWVELIFKSSPMDIEHGWNSEKTKFGPTDDGAGCYFKIKETLSDDYSIEPDQIYLLNPYNPPCK